ncbi:MAG: carboxypeptidase-like regulatory domain-containing protein [Planctomycetes bacterium]|nr:carboxypeptidase-like regulatory domain-containing protein [Planctomycetota bacterium]
MRKGASFFLLSFLVSLLVVSGCGQEPEIGGGAAGIDFEGGGESDPEIGEGKSPYNSQDAGGSAMVPEGQFDPATGTRVHVRVVTAADGQPLANCPVSLYWERSGSSALGRILTTTDEDGRGHFEIFQRTFVQKVVAMGTGSTAPEPHVLAQFVGSEEIETIELAVRPAARFAGRVLDQDGNPVPGAKVSAWTEDRWKVEGMTEVESTATGTADANGNFRMGGMPGGPFLLTAIADGMIAVQRAVGVNEYDEEIERIELVLAQANLVDGQVLDQEGNPVRGAIIEAGIPRRRITHTPTEDSRLIYIPGRQWIVESDRDGGFLLPGVPASEAWNIRIRHGSFRDFRDRFDAGSKVLQFRLQSGLEVHLRAVDTDSKPIPEGDVMILGASARPAPLRMGGAALLGLEEDADAIVMVRATGYAMKVIWPVRYNTFGDPLELVLEDASPIIGQVVDGNGEPISGVALIARGLDFLDSMPLGLRDAFPGKQPEEVFRLNRRASGEGGRFRFGQLYPGRWEITATHPDGRVTSEIFEAPRSDVRIIF